MILGQVLILQVLPMRFHALGKFGHGEHKHLPDVPFLPLPRPWNQPPLRVELVYLLTVVGEGLGLEFNNLPIVGARDQGHSSFSS